MQPGRISASLLALLFTATLLGSINLSPGHASALSSGSLNTWNTDTAEPLPQAVSSATSVVYNGYVYDIGGYDSSFSPLSTVYYAPINANGSLGAWVNDTSEPLPQPTGDATSVVYDGYVYELGGINGNTSSTQSTVYYAPINSNGSLGAWVTDTTEPLPQALYVATSVVYNGYVYELGGQSGANQSTVYYAPINSNGSLGAWVNDTSAPLPQVLEDATSVVYDGYVYELGGNNGSGNLSTAYYSGINTGTYQLTSRSMTISSSEPSDAGVSYQVSVDSAAAGSLQTIVVDFCSNSPVMGATCTAPTGFSLGSTPTVGNLLLGGTADTGTWTVSTPNSGRTLVFTRGSPVPVTSGESISFDIDNVTNPSATGTFYSRMLTYPFPQTGYTDTSPGAYTQFGGFALSTASPIDLSATVQESISFCVYQSTCGSPLNVALGHTIGSATVIDSTVVDTQAVNFSISTNANNGAAISILGSTLTDASGQTIPAMTTSGAITAGTADFGLYLSTLGSGMSVASPYGSTSSSYYYGASSSTATEIASCSAPVNNTVSTITYGVTASNNTPSGIYTATHQLIATGTF